MLPADENCGNIDRNQVRTLKVLLHGTVVNGGEDQRVYMSSCEFRSDLYNQLDCEFVLKACLGSDLIM